MKLRLPLAVLLAAAGTFLLLLAVGASRWRARVAAGDATYRTDPAPRGLWTPSQVLPGGIARNLLGVDDDLRLREGLRVFRLGDPRRLAWLEPAQLVALRNKAQLALTATAGRERDPRRRSRELNLVGVLQLVTIDPIDLADRALTLLEAADSFRAALAADPSNEEASFNLEIALRISAQIPRGVRAQANAGQGAAHAHAAGSGY